MKIVTEDNFYHSVTDLLNGGFCSISIPAFRIKTKQKQGKLKTMQNKTMIKY